MKKISLSIGRIALGAILAYGILNFIDHPETIIKSFKAGVLYGFSGK